MIVTTIHHTEIKPEDKKIEVSIFDKERGILIKHSFNKHEKVHLNLYTCEFYTANHMVDYYKYTDEFPDSFHFYGYKIENCKELKDYIARKISEDEKLYRNEQIKSEIEELQTKIDELNKKLKD